MSVNPLNSYITSADALYFTKAETLKAIQDLSGLTYIFNNPVVSTISINNTTGVLSGGLNWTCPGNLTISSINGTNVPLAIQTTATNAGTQSGFVPTSGQWNPFVSTASVFSWTAGKVYDLNANLGMNITTGPAAAANMSVGVGLPGGTSLPNVVYNVHNGAGETQVLCGGNLRAVVVPTTSGTGPIVAYLYPTAGDYTISGQMANSTGFPALLQQLN